MATVSAGSVQRISCPLLSSVTVTPGQSARVIVDDGVPGGAVAQIIGSAQTYTVSAGGFIEIEAIGSAATYTSTVTIATPNGGSVALSEAVAVVTLTATGTAVTGACEFRGIVVRAISGTPQTVTVYDATSATGTAIATFSVSAVGTYYWDGDWATAGNGNGGRRVNSTGCHVVISGGTSRTVDVMVE